MEYGDWNSWAVSRIMGSGDDRTKWDGKEGVDGTLSVDCILVPKRIRIEHENYPGIRFCLLFLYLFIIP